MRDPEAPITTFFLGVGPDGIQFSTNMHFKAYLKKKRSQNHSLNVILMIMLNQRHNIKEFSDVPLINDACTKIVCCMF